MSSQPVDSIRPADVLLVELPRGADNLWDSNSGMAALTTSAPPAHLATLGVDQIAVEEATSLLTVLIADMVSGAAREGG